jgi:hypothetical protein
MFKIMGLQTALACNEMLLLLERAAGRVTRPGRNRGHAAATAPSPTRRRFATPSFRQHARRKPFGAAMTQWGHLSGHTGPAVAGLLQAKASPRLRHTNLGRAYEDRESLGASPRPLHFAASPFGRPAPPENLPRRRRGPIRALGRATPRPRRPRPAAPRPPRRRRRRPPWRAPSPPSRCTCWTSACTSRLRR